MDTPTPPMPQSKTGLYVVMGLLSLLIILVIFVLLRVYSAVPELPERVSPVVEQSDETQEETVADEETSLLQDALVTDVFRDIANGVLVEQSTRNGNWKATVRYPALAVSKSPAFSLSYPPSAHWGLMRVAYQDATATSHSGFGTPPYLSFFTFRASNYYASGNEGMTFDIAVSDKDGYYEVVNKPSNVYLLNNDIFLSEDDDWVYLYRYKNKDATVRVAVDELLKSFIPLNLDNK